MKATTFAYVCAPIHSGASLTSAKRKEYCKTLFELGYVPICPSMMFSRFLSDNVPEQREARRAMSLELLRRCRVYDEYGCAHWCIDEEMRRRLETKLITRILTFKLTA